MQNLKGKVVEITGTGEGIGKAIVLKLSEHGVMVIFGARNVNQLENFVAAIRNNCGEALFVKIDVGDKIDLLEFVNAAVEKYGNLRCYH